MTESQKEFLFKAMLKDLGVSYYKRIKKNHHIYEFVITKKLLFIFPCEYKIGQFEKEGDDDMQYYLYGMPETNNKITWLLIEFLDLRNGGVQVISQADNPERYYGSWI